MPHARWSHRVPGSTLRARPGRATACTGRRWADVAAGAARVVARSGRSPTRARCRARTAWCGHGILRAARRTHPRRLLGDIPRLRRSAAWQHGRMRIARATLPFRRRRKLLPGGNTGKLLATASRGIGILGGNAQRAVGRVATRCIAAAGRGDPPYDVVPRVCGGAPSCLLPRTPVGHVVATCPTPRRVGRPDLLRVRETAFVP